MFGADEEIKPFFCILKTFEESMRYLWVFFLFVSTIFADSDWKMVKSDGPLSYHANFNILNRSGLVGKVIRSGLFTPRYYYDLYSDQGEFLARGINRVFSLGLISPSQMEFDIYDSEKNRLGYVGGKFWTSGLAKFAFKNPEGDQIGFAFLSSDASQATFSILSDRHVVVASLNGERSGDLSQWELVSQEPLEIDSRIVKIFTAFISDFHEAFIMRPEVNFHTIREK